MTALRQFFSILLNAGVFGNFSAIGFSGWVGIGFVASGIFIKMDRRFDEVQPRSRSDSQAPLLPTLKVTDSEKGSTSQSLGDELVDVTLKAMLKRMSVQYGLPLTIPLFVALVCKALA